jgi:hypothetical protein
VQGDSAPFDALIVGGLGLERDAPDARTRCGWVNRERRSSMSAGRSAGLRPLVSLSVSPYVALGSLIYLVAIHKLEYLLNARIVGRQIEARAWELLLAMLLMEAMLGIAGLIAAPIHYAYLKDELIAAGWV